MVTFTEEVQYTVYRHRIYLGNLGIKYNKYYKHQYMMNEYLHWWTDRYSLAVISCGCPSAQQARDPYSLSQHHGPSSTWFWAGTGPTLSLHQCSV